MSTKKAYRNILGVNLEDDLNYLSKWKITTIFMQMEDDLNYLGK